MDSKSEDKKSLFIKVLKESYTRQYKAVQPVPNRPEMLHSVEKVFVGGGVEQQDKTDTGTTWRRLASYHEIFRDDIPKTMRRVVEGEPGYGKSTLTLQAAYDWCNNERDSPFSDVEILIILRLRQFCGVKSIFNAIKRLLVANEPRLKVNDIERIINECSSVHIILDGYDEYPDRQTDENNEVQNIIKGNKMEETEVTLLTRNIQDLENYLPPNHQRFKLTGFDDKAKDEYLHKTVEAQGGKEGADRVKRILRENYFLDDFCQVPLIFVMLVYMVHNKADFKQIKTVTGIFRYIVSLFHDHMENKTTNINVRKLRESYVNSHDVLDKLALDGLIAGRVTWRKNDLIEQLGQEFYDQYVSAGILVEDLIIDDSVAGSYSQYEVTETRFYHKLLCEWYAANALVKEKDIRDVCGRLDPFELHYLYRFACGLSKRAHSVITESLRMRSGTDIFIILCLFEYNDNEDEFLKSIRDLCSRELRLGDELNRLSQRSMIQMLEIASSNNIPITCLNMSHCVVCVDKYCITLTSGLSLQRLSSLEKIRISEYYQMKRFTQDDILNLFCFVQQSKLIQQLSVEGFDLPAAINPSLFSFKFRSKGVNVSWTCTNVELTLDFQSGLWKVGNKQKFEGAFVRNPDRNRKIRQSDYPFGIIALYNDIPVQEVNISPSHLTDEEIDTTRKLNLQHHLSNVETIHLKETGYDSNVSLTNKELANIIEYSKLFKRLKELRFKYVQPPIKFPENLLCLLRASLCIPKVLWRPLYRGIDFRLNLVTGEWEISDINELTFGDYQGLAVSLSSRDSAPQRWVILQLLDIAARHSIPVSQVSIGGDIQTADDDKVVLQSDYTLKSSPMIEKLQFEGYTSDMQYTVELLSGLLKYAEKSQRLQELRFLDCALPNSIPFDCIPLNLRERNLRVTRRCQLIEFYMDLESGHWEAEDSTELKRMCSGPIIISHDRDQRVFQLLIMEIASRHNIEIPSLCLINSFSKVEDNMIILSYGDASPPKNTTTDHASAEILPDNLLPPILTLRKLEIISTTEKEMSANVLLEISGFGQQCKALEEIRITDVLLSGSLSSVVVPSVPIIWRLQVLFGARWDYRLNWERARWEIEDVDSLRKICESPIHLRGWDTKLIQTSTIQILKMACRYDFPVSCLVLEESFANIREDGIVLTSGLAVPNLRSLGKLVVVSERGKILNNSQVREIIGCSQMFEQLKEICFNDKVLPLTIDPDDVKQISRDFKVSWGYYGYKFDPEKCLWEVDDIEVLKGLCSNTVLINNDEDQSLHECQILLLINASNLLITVPRLVLNESFSKMTGDSIVLSSGSSLPHLSTVKEIELWMPHGQSIEVKELLAILEYGKDCKQLTNINFIGCVLPYKIPEEYISSIPPSVNIQVSWLTYQLDSEKGTWQDMETLTDVSEDQYQSEVELMQKPNDTSNI